MLPGDDQLQKLIKLVGPLEFNLRLPVPPKEFFAARGAAQALQDDKRRFSRNCLRVVAALQHRPSLPALPRPVQWYKVVTCDISRNGIRLLHSVQLYPMEQFSLVLPDGNYRFVEVIHCRRLVDRCYEIGASFISGFRDKQEA